MCTNVSQHKILEQFSEKNAKGRSYIYYTIECANCGSISKMRKDVYKKATTCNQCSRASGHNTKHGKSASKLYAVYYGMLQRCTNKAHPKYSRYGGRGIKVEFTDFFDFESWSLANGYVDATYTEYKDTLAIDRIDNNGNYSKDNCQWITVSENSKKKLGPYKTI